MKKIISFALVLTFVLAMFTCGYAEEVEKAKIPGVAHYTGEWEVINDGKGIRSHNGASILLLEKTAKSGTIEFTVQYNEAMKGQWAWVGFFFQASGVEKIVEIKNDDYTHEMMDESVYAWLRQAQVTCTDCEGGLYKDPRSDGKTPVHSMTGYADTVGADYAEMTEYTVKFEFGPDENGKRNVTTYINGVKGATLTNYEANGEQIAFRGKTGKNAAGEDVYATFSNIKVNGEEILFVEKPTQTGDATVIAVAAVSFAVLACGAVLTISKKRIAE